MWYVREVIADILSLPKVKNKFPVSYDISGENAFIVKKNRRRSTIFEGTTGLVYLDTKYKATKLVNTEEKN